MKIILILNVYAVHYNIFFFKIHQCCCYFDVLLASYTMHLVDHLHDGSYSKSSHVQSVNLKIINCI